MREVLMREILFRGKRMDNGKWIWGAHLTTDSRHFIFNEDDTAQVDPGTIGQFSGLVDKNGVKIFEDDIMKAEVCGCLEDTFVMYFYGCFFICDLDGEEIPLFEYMDKESGKVEEAEVIGNTYDNWDLLEA